MARYIGIGIAHYHQNPSEHDAPERYALETWYPVVIDGHDPANADLANAIEALSSDRRSGSTAPLLGGVVDLLRSASSPQYRQVFNLDETPVNDDSPFPRWRQPVVTFIDDLDAPANDVHDVYLRLHLLSMRLVKPRGLNIEGFFGILQNVAWTDHGPYRAEDANAAILAFRSRGKYLRVHGVDKFPAMTDYFVPSGVRIADTARVRLGAYLAPGTTVMHEGFVNFNAGTLGPSMVEGRISQGVIVGANTDIGGGASIMGTLSGGGKEKITIGERCLLGANSGTGISLGDDCIVEAGLYVTAGTPVYVVEEGKTVRARELSGKSGLLFLRDGQTGRVEARPNTKAVELNPALHATNAANPVITP